MKPKKRATMNAVGNHALRREVNEKRRDHNIARLEEAGIPYGKGPMRPSRVVRLAERAFARNEAAKVEEERLAMLLYSLGVTVDGEDLDA